MMILRKVPWLALTMLVGFQSEVSQAQTRAGEWPMYNRDLAGTRHSPLDQINASNVAGLERVWSYQLGRNTTTGDLTGGSESTPIMVGGVLYVAASDRLVALEPETGQEIWRYELGDERAPSRRGLSYWPGDGEHPARIFFTSNQRLIGLEAGAGELASGFGDGGVTIMSVLYHGAPLVYGNLLVVGSNSTPGGVRAFDAVTGDQVWEFIAVPKEGELGYDTWENDSTRDQTNVYHWAFSMTMDAERGLLYAVFESAGPHDYWGGNRPGDNLFANSVVALDIATGERKWYFQTVHHDLWDYDLTSPPGLLDVTIDGEKVPILALSAKTGYMYILNRETGEPVFGIEEVPVPQSGVPGEHSSPTQPIPVKPPPIAKVSYSPEDIVTAEDTSEEHARFCRELVQRSGGFYNAGPYTPYAYRAPGAPPRSSIHFPGSVGGANWGATASDPTLGYVFVNTMDEASFGWVEEHPNEDALFAYRRNSIVGPMQRFHWFEGDPEVGNVMNSGESAWLCNKPPWAHLVAVNAASGDIAWKVPLGITEELPEAKQRTGRMSFGGPITTAGGLVFIAATNDRRFRAFDSRTGRELWVAKLDMSARAVPMTYLGKDGRQYVAILAAAASHVDDPSPPEDQALVVFALP